MVLDLERWRVRGVLSSRFARRWAIALVAFLLANVARAEWHREQTSIAWTDKNGATLWRFSFDPKMGKPFFDPVAVAGGPSLTNFKPEDHPWHYGLWFSWKTINEANYWEENRQTGRSQGRTTWRPPMIQTGEDGSALIRMELTYTHPSGRVDLRETRRIHISAPAADGSYMLRWNATFTAGTEGSLLDRTPMPGEPDGRFNGGYAGLSIRMAGPPLTMDVVSPEGAITDFVQDRARPATQAIACTFREGATAVGGIAIISHPDNGGFGAAAPWYIINGAEMRFICAAVLAPNPIRLEPGAEWELSYRIALRPGAWTPESLQEAVTAK